MGLPWTLSTGLKRNEPFAALEEMSSAGNFKLLRSPGIDSMESILLAYVAWWAGTQPYYYSAPSPIACSKIPAQLLIRCKMYIADSEFFLLLRSPGIGSRY
jgi:hypothetical protein